MTEPNKRNQQWLYVVGVLVGVVLLIGRVVADRAADEYGRRVAGMVAMVSPAGFANTVALRRELDSPEMSELRKRVKRLRVLGKVSAEKMDDLDRGMIYLSEQMSLPPEERFANPPTLRRLHLKVDDRSDAGVAEAAAFLVTEFQPKR